MTRDDPDPVLFRTKKGTPLRASDIQRLADEAERGYCVAPAMIGSVGRHVCGHPLPCPLHPDTDPADSEETPDQPKHWDDARKDHWPES